MTKWKVVSRNPWAGVGENQEWDRLNLPVTVSRSRSRRVRMTRRDSRRSKRERRRRTVNHL